MSALVSPIFIPAIEYPSSDGKPMAENTVQARWITTIYGNLTSRYRDRDDVFVAIDNLWYPVEGHKEICTAPDVYVVFGRPKSDRPSYLQWLENDTPLTVVFEILSPGNTGMEMTEKLSFYDEYGVEEYYLFDPDKNSLAGWMRKGEVFRKVRPIAGHVSPRLGIRFDVSGPELMIYHPDGRQFLTFAERDRQYDRLRELGRRARLGQATPDELRELESLEGP